MNCISFPFCIYLRVFSFGQFICFGGQIVRITIFWKLIYFALQCHVCLSVQEPGPKDEILNSFARELKPTEILTGGQISKGLERFSSFCEQRLSYSVMGDIACHREKQISDATVVTPHTRKLRKCLTFESVFKNV